MNFKVFLLFLTTIIAVQTFRICPHPNFLYRNLVCDFNGSRTDAALVAAEKSNNTYALIYCACNYS